MPVDTTVDGLDADAWQEWYHWQIMARPQSTITYDSNFNDREIYEIMNFVKITTHQSYFKHNKNIYFQNDGFVIRNTLIAILSVYMYTTMNC